MNNTDVKNILSAYTHFFSDEESELKYLEKEVCRDESITTRKNTLGHVTVSGLVVKDNSVLLIYHNKLQKYIQPGGHLEDDNSFWEGAQREVEEETGLSVSLHRWHVENAYIPIHIDTHKIPFNEKKQEQEHFHHDFTYVFTVADTTITLQSNEVVNFKWVPLTTDFGEKLLNRACQKIVTFGIAN